jgi:hypothetical protein
MRTVAATRYVTPLREGGSLPAIVEADDDGLYVVKFRAAGQGAKALVAELVCGELARAAGLRVPEVVRVEIGPELGRNEPDGEIRELLKGSVGLNVGLDYLPGSLAFDPVAGPQPAPSEASEIVWFDSFVSNVDRTARNPNLLTWHRQLWLIDHGAALYFHHGWDRAPHADRSPFPLVREHVLLAWATELPAAGERLAARLSPDVLARALDEVPDEWLADEPRAGAASALRAAYVKHLAGRLQAASIFVEEALRARAQLV